MVRNSVIEKIKPADVKMVSKKEKEGESSPALMVVASLDSGGEDVGGSGSILCLWAENSSHPWMVRNSVIEKINQQL
jgi:hypothetical protein